ncbi:unnamed protein product [Lactuca virosa]|uniref:Uncharacterized protein n=1 Tax=Lactuca virosa TaxID=75947 RepID=A0AAU9M8E5_9ASTR|nr:unnamed protein product [Lactuca virosa]
MVKVLDKVTPKSLGDSRSLLMKLDTGGVALYQRRGTPSAVCRWKASERRGSTGWVSLESAGRRGGAGRRSGWEASARRETSEVGEAVNVES